MNAKCPFKKGKYVVLRNNFFRKKLMPEKVDDGLHVTMIN